MIRVGLISDTHGLLRPQALAALQGSDHILHAGDIGGPEILAALAAIAPVTAVCGNNDECAELAGWREREMLTLGGIKIHLIHNIAKLDIDPRAADVRVVMYGHSHRPLVEDRAGVLYLNPGSAGPRRFKLPITVGEMRIEGGDVQARIVELDVGGA